MVLVEVFRRNLQISYQSGIISKATFLVFVCAVFSVIFPLIFTYNSRGFLVEKATFYEQPNVSFSGEYVFTATTRNNDSNIICSTDPSYEEAVEMYDVCSSIKYKEVDANFDQKIDEFVFLLELNLPIDMEITSFNVILLFNFRLEDYFCPLKMRSAVIFQQILPIPLTELIVIGDLAIRQKEAISCHERYTNKIYNKPIIRYVNDTNSTEGSVQVQSIIEKYSARNLTTKLDNVYTMFSNTDPLLFKLDFRMKIAEMQFSYRPRFWEVFKWAWIQYFAIYSIVAWLVCRFKRYVFKNRLVLFYKDSPLKKKQ